MPDGGPRLLSLDGGGVRGLSSLIILKQFMETVNPESPPEPHEYFDIIGGTSTGGHVISALMLGRLRMSIDDCIDAYTSLSDRIFQKKRHHVSVRGRVQGRFDAGELEKVFKEIIEGRGLEEDALLKDSPDAKCKVVVFARNKDINKPVPLSSYRPVRGYKQLFGKTKIWEAARATSAASSFFDPIKIGGSGQEFVDGATGANNPIYDLWTEAQDLWPQLNLEKDVKCLISIGTGKFSTGPISDNLLEIHKILVDMATETEDTAERFIRDRREMFAEGRYYRFNVQHGLSDIVLEDSSRKNVIISATDRYIASQEVFSWMQLFSRRNETSNGIDRNEIKTFELYDQEGYLAYQANAWTSAISQFKKALEESGFHKVDADRVARTRRYYAEALYMAREYKLAQTQFEECLSWAVKKFGPDHVETAKRRRSLGDALRACGHWTDAREQFRLAFSVFERNSNGADTIHSLHCRYEHGILASAGEAYDRSWPHWPQAEESLRRASQGFTAQLGAASNEAFLAQIGYARVLLKMCKDKEALSHFETARRIACQKRLPAGNEIVMQIERNLEECNYWLNKPPSVRSADRRPKARARAEQEWQKREWRLLTGHW